MLTNVLVEEVEKKFDMAGAFLDVSKGLSGETISSLILVGIICLLCIYIAIRAKFTNPLKRPWGIVFLAEVGVDLYLGLYRITFYNRLSRHSIISWINYICVNSCNIHAI